MGLKRRAVIAGSAVLLAGCQEVSDAGEQPEPSDPNDGNETDEGEPKDPPAEPSVSIEATGVESVGEWSARIGGNVTEMANVDEVTVSVVVYQDGDEVARESETVSDAGPISALVTDLDEGSAYEWALVADVDGEMVTSEGEGFETEESDTGTGGGIGGGGDGRSPSIEITIDAAGASAGGDPDKSE